MSATARRSARIRSGRFAEATGASPARRGGRHPMLDLQAKVGNRRVVQAMGALGHHVGDDEEESQGAGGGSTAACEPEALDRTDYLARDGTSRDDFGLTTMDASSARLAFSFTRRGRRVRVNLDESPQMPAVSSVSTAAGRFGGDQGPTTTIAVDATRGPCVGRRDIERIWVVTSSGAAKIAQAEQEHCADFRYAFDETLVRFAAAVTRASRRSYSSERQAERAMRRYAGGIAPDEWLGVWTSMLLRTRLRDRRGYHDPVIGSRDAYVPQRGTRCFVRIAVSERNLPHVGRHPTDTIMRPPT